MNVTCKVALRFREVRGRLQVVFREDNPACPSNPSQEVVL